MDPLTSVVTEDATLDEIVETDDSGLPGAGLYGPTNLDVLESAEMYSRAEIFRNFLNQNASLLVDDKSILRLFSSNDISKERLSHD